MAKIKQWTQSFEELLLEYKNISEQINLSEMEILELKEELERQNLSLFVDITRNADVLKEQTGMPIDKAREFCLNEMKQLKQNILVNSIVKYEVEISGKNIELQNLQIRKYMIEKKISMAIKTADNMEKKIRLIQVN